MDFSTVQREALDRAQAILDEAGLSPCDLESTSAPSPSPSLSLPSTPSTPLSVPLLAILGSQYIFLPTRPFMDEEIGRCLNRVNRYHHSDVHSIIYHPPGAIVEYPQTGSVISGSIAHIFTVDPNNFDNPKTSFQYSLGDNHGGHSGVVCGLLRDQFDKLVKCNKLTTSCKSLQSFSNSLTQKITGKGLKVCSEHDPNTLNIMHSFVSHVGVQNQIVPMLPSFGDDACRVVFDKTLALFSVLHQHRCSFRVSGEAIQEHDHLLDGTVGFDSDSDSDLDLDLDTSSDTEIGNMDSLSMDGIDVSRFGPCANFDRVLQHFTTSWGEHSAAGCKGRIIMKQDRSGHHFIQYVVCLLLTSLFDKSGPFCRCEHRTHRNQSHLIIRNLQEYDTDYLQALLEGDEASISSFELNARRLGYGPRLPCSFVAPHSKQKMDCRTSLFLTICLSINSVFFSIFTSFS